MEVNEELVYNFIVDLKKKDIDDVDKGMLIKQYMQEHNLSLKSACKEFGLPKTTLQNWLCFAKVNKEELLLLTKKGYSKRNIRDAVYKNKIDLLLSDHAPNHFDLLIEELITKLRGYTNKDIEMTCQTSLLVHNLKELVVKIEQRVKK